MEMRVNPIQIQQVLEQMRTITQKMQTDEQASNVVNQSASTETANFSQVLKTALQEVNDTQQSANTLKEAFAAGDPSINLVDVMLQSQKAGIEFEATVQVRNKLINAYKEIMNMPV